MSPATQSLDADQAAQRLRSVLQHGVGRPEVPTGDDATPAAASLTLLSSSRATDAAHVAAKDIADVAVTLGAD